MNNINLQKQINKISIIFLVIISILSNNIYAKYNYMITLDAFALSRDTSEIIYQIEKSVEDNTYTNKDVVLKIVANKEIEEIEGFVLDDTRTTLTKTISENEEKSIVLEDLSGNKKEIEYKINNIDKESPQIVGIENGKTYNTKMNIDYTDNIGIKDIKVERYDSNLIIQCIGDYYDTGFYKGIDVLGNQIYVDVTARPKGTKSYKFYLNNVLKASTEKSEYTYKGLSNLTDYVIKVEAINENNQVIKTVSQTVKTKAVVAVSGNKSGNNFTANISGINNNASLIHAHLWHQDSGGTRKVIQPSINVDRSLNYSFNVYDVNGSKSSGYYYLHFQFYDSNLNLLDTICMNIIFDTTYVKKDDDIIDKYNLNQSGNYEIVVTDLAGNETKKTCTIKI